MHKEPPEPNKQGPFPVSAIIPPQHLVHGTGSMISTTGLTFVLDFPLSGKESDIEVTIRNHKIPIRVKIKSAEAAGRRMSYMAKFIGIKADDWDRIVRYIHGFPDIEHFGSYFNPDIPDDDYRLLPMKIQETIINELVSRRRLIAPCPGTAPLIQIKKVGETRRKDGHITRKISVQSRIIQEDEPPKDSNTLFAIDSDGLVEVLS